MYISELFIYELAIDTIIEEGDFSSIADELRKLAPLADDAAIVLWRKKRQIMALKDKIKKELGNQKNKNVEVAQNEQQ